MPRPASDLRQRILAAARQTFAERGVDAAALRAIAKAAGTTIGMIYYYYPTKDDLYLGVVEESYGRLLEQLSFALSSPTTGPARLREQLQVMLRSMAGMSEEDRLVIAIVLRDVTVSAERRQRLFERFSRGHLPMLFEVVLRARAAGELRTDVNPVMMVLATAALNALSTIVLERLPLPGLPRGEERIAQTLELLFFGLCGPADTRTTTAPAEEAAPTIPTIGEVAPGAATAPAKPARSARERR